MKENPGAMRLRGEVGPGLCISHFRNVIVNPGRVRAATTTWLGVTFGSRGNGEKEGRTLEGVSIIEDRVSIGPGACLFGLIEVGHDVSVRAGAVLVSSLSRSSPDESLQPETGSGANG